MPRLSELISDRRPLDVAFGSATVHVDYCPQFATPDFLKRARAIDRLAASDRQAAELEGMTWISDMLPSLVAGWDLEGDDGEPLPLTPEAIAAVPFVVLVTIFQAIMADIQNPNPAAGTQSTGPSSATSPTADGSASPAIVQIGTPSSPTPAGRRSRRGA